MSTLTQTSSHTKFGTTGDIPVPRGPVDAVLNFYSPPSDGSKPFNYVEGPPEGQPRRNFGSAEHSVTIQDIDHGDVPCLVVIPTTAVRELTVHHLLSSEPTLSLPFAYSPFSGLHKLRLIDMESLYAAPFAAMITHSNVTLQHLVLRLLEPVTGTYFPLRSLSAYTTGLRHELCQMSCTSGGHPPCRQSHPRAWPPSRLQCV